MVLDQFYRRTRRGKLQSVIRERYLREDVGFGTLVGRGAIQSEEEFSNVLMDNFVFKNENSRILLVLDTNVVLKQIDVLELEDCAPFANVILCDTVLQEVKKNDLGIYNRLMVLLRDDKRCFIVFPNENFQDTFSKRKEEESPNDYNDRLVREVSKWFSNTIQGGSIAKVMLLTNDTNCRELAVKNKINAMTIHEFVRNLNAHDYPGLFDRVAEAQASELVTKQDGASSQLKPRFEAHLSESEIIRRLQMGTVRQGVFRQNRYNRRQGSVLVFDKAGASQKIVINGLQMVNRAIDGDKVVVEILQSTASNDQKNQMDDEDAAPQNEDDELIEEDAKDIHEATLAGTKLHVGETDTGVMGKVVGIIKRNWRPYCGSVDENDLKRLVKSEYVLVIPVDPTVPKIRIRTRQLDDIKDKRIIVSIDSWDQYSSFPNGHLVQVLGTIGDKATETAVVLHEYDIPTREFSKKVMKCLPSEGRDWIVTEENSVGRVDLRHLPICSIDPPGCKDIDDALHFQKLPNGNIEIGVHIADVTHFVRAGTAIDEEAAYRATSTYLVERRLDMLPGLLTTDICSLRGGVDRFAFSVIWEFTPVAPDDESVSSDRRKKSKKDHKSDTKNELQEVSVRFFKSIIHSKAALSYGEAQAWLEDPNDQSEIANNVRELNRVARVLRQRRNDLGALTLASQEVRFSIDKETHDPTDVQMYQQKEANQLVEEFMLLANISVARHIFKKYPRCSMLRRHPAPAPEMFEELLQATKVAGVELKVGNSKELADSLDRANNPTIPYFNKLMRILTTRCMMQAVYFSSGDVTPPEFRHYGLASDIYTHFTSPIRRYADVIVHRLLAAAEGIDPLPLAYERKDDMKAIADNCNLRHHNAQLAGRASSSLHTLVYFRNRATDTIAVVSRVRSRGVVVMVPDYGIEGKISLAKSETEAAELFDYDPEQMRLTHKVSGLSIAIFQQVRVRLSVEESYGHRESLVVSLLEPTFATPSETLPVVAHVDSDKKTKKRGRESKK